MGASKEITVPVFDGSDDADPAYFIHTIQAKAFAEGKDTDQEWILRLVAASLAGDALRWRVNLKPEIQNDWALFQKELLARFCVPFKGIDGTECEKFVYSLRRRVFEEGRTEDDEWIAGFVGSSVAKGALRWYADLAPEIQMSPLLLQKAMLERYPPPEVRQLDSKTGVIRFFDPNNPDFQPYLSCALPLEGYLNLCYNRAGALYVEYDDCGTSSMFTIKNLDGTFNLLGIQWDFLEAMLESDRSYDDFARVVGINGPRSSLNFDEYRPVGTTHSDVWTVQPNGVIDIIGITSDGAKVMLFPRSSGSEIVLAGERCRRDSDGWTRGRLVFQMV